MGIFWSSKNGGCCEVNTLRDDIDTERSMESEKITKKQIKENKKLRNKSHVRYVSHVPSFECAASEDVNDINDDNSFTLDTKSMTIIMGLNNLTPTPTTPDTVTPSFYDRSFRGNEYYSNKDREEMGSILESPTPESRVTNDTEIECDDNKKDMIPFMDDNDTSYSDEIFESEPMDLDDINNNNHKMMTTAPSQNLLIINRRKSNLLREQSEGQWDDDDIDGLEFEMKQQMVVLQRESLEKGMNGLKDISYLKSVK